VHLKRSYEIRNAFMLEPAQRLELGDLLEALIAVGELDKADEGLATWQERADALDRAAGWLRRSTRASRHLKAVMRCKTRAKA